MRYRTTSTEVGAPAPPCDCHGERMQKNGIARGRQQWVCGVARNERDRERDPIRNKNPWRKFQQRSAARNRASAKDLELIRELTNHLKEVTRCG